eukprot:Em0004g611a
MLGERATMDQSSGSAQNNRMLGMISLWDSVTFVIPMPPVQTRAMRAILKDLLLRGGYNTSEYNTHSLRIGAATAAARAGLPSSTRQQQQQHEQAPTIHHPAAGDGAVLPIPPTPGIHSQALQTLQL